MNNHGGELLCDAARLKVQNGNNEPIYLSSQRAFPPQSPLLGSCLDASNRLHRLALCDNKSRDPSKTGITIQLQHGLVPALPSQHSKQIFVLLFLFFFNYVDLWMLSGPCTAVPGCFIQYVQHALTDDTQLQPAVSHT